VSAAASLEFRFDAREHEYMELATGVVLPHITGMLERAGWIDDTWFTEESSSRGQAVHKLTADYDLGAIEDVTDCDSVFKGYLLAHVKAMSILRPTILAVEQPLVHPVYRYGGRPDRDVVIDGVRGVLEIKSGQKEKSHPIQTALQAILVSVECGIPAPGLSRRCAYYTPNGRFKIEEHKVKADFTEALKIIKECAR